MVDPSKVLEVLRDARGRIDSPEKWWDGGEGGGDSCALLALASSAPDHVIVFDSDASLATLAVASAAGIQGDLDEAICSLPGWNDAHAHAEVLAAFDKAIATLEAELAPDPTPTADALLAIHAAGNAVAASIVAEHPHMPLAEVEALARTELFYAAQDTAEACSLGVVLERA